MRVLGPLVVMLSLLFGAGGVAVRSQASDQPETEATAEADPLGQVIAHALEASPTRKTCRAVAQQPASVTIDLSKVKVPAGFVSLNRMGYNYRKPGDPPQIIPDSTGTKRPEAAPKP